MHTNFARSIYRAMQDKEVTQAKIAEKTGLAQPTITRLISDDRRPDERTLHALCNCWGDPMIELGLLCEHLRDEIHRAGKLDSDIVVHPADRPPRSTKRLDANLDLIRAEALEHGDMDSLIEDMAAIIRRNRSGRALPMAAESRPKYPRKN